MPYRQTRTWREWFFEVFAPNGRIPFNPLPETEAEKLDRAERQQQDQPNAITRLNLDAEPPPR